MPKPRVFVSSTHYDLREVRTSLSEFINSLGFEAVLSEAGNIVYGPDRALDESCYREAESADIFVLLIGRRYGMSGSGSPPRQERGFYERYDSITKREYLRARARGVPIYVAIDRIVLSELEVYRLNRDSTAVRYAHAESVNVFDLIEAVMAETNITTLPFDKSAEIAALLREQWAGHYRELLNRRSELNRLSDLESQVVQLKNVSETLKTYMEAVLKRSDPGSSATLIAAEGQRLETLRRQEALRANSWTKFMARNGMALDDYVDAMRASDSSDDFLARAGSFIVSERRRQLLRQMLSNTDIQNDFNAARALLDCAPVRFGKSVE